MHQGDTTSPYHQFYQPPFQNPNPSPNPIDPQTHSTWPAAASYASAPPASGGGYASAPPSSDHANYSSGYPPYTQSSDHVPNSNSAAPTGFSYPHDRGQPPYYSYDQNQAALSYAPPNPSSAPDVNPSYSGAAFASSTYAPPPSVPNYGTSSYEGGGSLNRWGGYMDEGAGRYGEQGVYNSKFNQEGYGDEGVYRYEGGKKEPYGARGTVGSRSSSEALFDDYGRPINMSQQNEYGGSKVPTKVVKAVPKADTDEDMKSGVQKFRVKLLSEGFGQTDMDVLCQIGLDGIRMLDPATSRTLRIYSLDIVTRWEVLDSYIFAFWAKTPVDIEPKRIRLKSSSYTTNTILDTVTAASVQLKEMGDRKEADYPRTSEQQMERKKGLADWMNIIKPPNEEKDHWVPDEAVKKCTSCAANFNAFVRRHHCRNCGEIFCDKCTQGRTPLTADDQAPVRVCDRCMAEVTQRLANAQEATGRIGAMRSHEDLAKRLKEEMNRNAKASSGSTANGSNRQMREVACPTCTVHLQVQVPSSGSETIECSVCQSPFLVSAH